MSWLNALLLVGLAVLGWIFYAVLKGVLNFLIPTAFFVVLIVVIIGVINVYPPLTVYLNQLAESIKVLLLHFIGR